MYDLTTTTRKEYAITEPTKIEDNYVRVKDKVTTVGHGYGLIKDKSMNFILRHLGNFATRQKRV